MYTLLVRPPTLVPQYEKVREVPLNYQGHESTLLVNCGSELVRVVIDQWVYARELRAYCETRRGWRIASDADLFVTDHAGVVRKHRGKKAGDAVIQPTVQRVEWMKEMGEKG